ncbi:MAG: right-handed parallel beta-helix repeat-containing protein [Actinomycetota bacterium]|nr:right-handed parallel beta-helix repeat-containing protein [Actinomycetota bacterium]
MLSRLALVLLALAGSGGVLGGFPGPAEAKVVDVRTYATCSGASDDTQGLQRALDELSPGDSLHVAKGRDCGHSDVIWIRNAGVRLMGPGTITATNESRSAVTIAADDVTVENLRLRMAATTRRWDAYEQMKLRVAGHARAVIRKVTVDGAAAAGIFVGNAASDYLIEDVTVSNTRADGIHNTDGASNGIIRRPTLRNTGDDGVAVVSYESDQRVVHHVRVESPRFYGNTWGRAYAVVGGEDIQYLDVYAESSNAAGIYVAAEGHPYYTFAPRRIRVSGGLLKRSNTNPGVDHGAVLIYNGRPGYRVANVIIDDLAVEDTRSTASRQIGVFGDDGASFAALTLSQLRVTGGGSPMWATNAPSTAFDEISISSADTALASGSMTPMALGQSALPRGRRSRAVVRTRRGQRSKRRATASPRRGMRQHRVAGL